MDTRTERTEKTEQAVKRVLRVHHQGKESGITAKTLAGWMGCTKRELRDAVSALRLAGVPICSSPATGYFFPINQDELLESCELLHKRAIHSLTIVSRMRNISLHELVGQLELEVG